MAESYFKSSNTKLDGIRGVNPSIPKSDTFLLFFLKFALIDLYNLNYPSLL